MSTPRRRFLGWLGSASLLSAVGSPSLLRADAGQRGPLTDRHALPLADPHALPVAETWDMSWTSRVTGKYKAVFDSPEAADGAAVYRAVSWIEQYKEIYNAAPTEMSAVVVLRHLGFFFAMNDEYWERYEVGKELKIRDDKGRKWTKINPLGPAGAGADEKSKKFSLAGFQAGGGIVLACAWSFGGAVAAVTKGEKLDREAAKARARELLMPGVILQPNGIFAALRAQEAGCSYVLAS